VTWKTALESNTFGFYILRSANDNRAEAVKVSDTMLTAEGANSSYSLVDERGQANSRYWLQEIELDGTQNEHGPIKTTALTVQPQPGTQLQPQPQPVVNPVGGAVVVGGGVPVASLQSPVSQPQNAQQAMQPQAAQQSAQQQQQPAAQAPAQAAQQPAQQPAVASPLNTTNAAAQPVAQPVSQQVQAQPAQVTDQQPAPSAQVQPVAVAEVQSAPAQAAAVPAAQPAQNVPAVGAQEAVGVVRGGAPADAPELTMTAQPASTPANPWVPIATALTLLGLGAAGAFVLYRKKMQK
jgi:hypothetical protein